MKKLLLLGGSRYLLPVIETAHRLGIEVHTADYLPNNVAHAYADAYHNVSIIEKEAVLALAKKEHIDGIMSFATDPGVVTAAYVAEKMGLPGCPYESVEILQNKDRFRAFLRAHGFNAPDSRGFSSLEEVAKCAEHLRFPVVVKPVDSAGSKGVTCVHRQEELNAAVCDAFAHSLSGRIIIEDFLEKVGASSDTDCFSVNNALVFASFDCQYFDDTASNPFTPAAYSWPSDMPNDQQRELRSEIQRLIQLLNLGTSLYNIESRYCTDGKAYIMELSPRGGGNCLSEMLEMACGAKLIESAIRGALGIPITEDWQDPVYDGIWAEAIMHSNREGAFSHFYIEPNVHQKFVRKVSCWKKQGEPVRGFSGANEAVGTIAFRFPNKEEMQAVMQDISHYVRVELQS